MVAALERKFKHLIINYKVKVERTMYNLQNELYELKYSFLKGTVENVTRVTPCKAKRIFKHHIL